jgi:uncharacterized protein YecT (DUF1311 family)
MKLTRKLRTYLILPAIFVAVLVSCWAQHMNSSDAPCRAAGSNAAITQCFYGAYGKADRELNRVYDGIRKVLAPEEFEKLQAAQRLWIQFRDLNCTAEKGLYDGGSASSMAYAACMEADTRQRAAELKTMYGWRLIKFGAQP